MQIGISEILEQVNKTSSPSKQIELLTKYDNSTLREVLRHVFDPRIKFLLPKVVKYTPNKLDDTHNMLYYEARKLYLFTDGGHNTLDQKKNNKLPYSNIKKRTIEKAFPGLIS